MRKHNTTRMIILTTITAKALTLKGIYSENNDYFIASSVMVIIALFFIVMNGTKKHYLSN